MKFTFFSGVHVAAGIKGSLERFWAPNRGWLLLTRDHIVDRAGGRWIDLATAALSLRRARSERDPVRFVDGFDSRLKPRRTQAIEDVAAADCASGADQSKTEYRHEQGQAVPSRARNCIILIMLLRRASSARHLQSESQHFSRASRPSV